ncbi:hypothetical protein ACK320_12820 [Aeromonas caviae]|uniref:hypothetical protein n=1 Tax=Aeromonas taiwanensis TaxID=633417 RepID=UPI003A252512
MTPHDLYQTFAIKHQELPKGVTPEQYAKVVTFDIVTLHAPAKARYSYSTGQDLEQARQATGQQTSLYTY